ncbi:MAG TPA: hypothetical protein VFV78_10015 [Vicinamibacterales bacterium]|nr:hypothetical protein [Vicinamibacterales bacterium]
MKASSAAIVFAASSLVLASASGTGAQGQAVGRPEWAAASRHDTSRPLREMPARPAISTREDFEVKQESTRGQAGQPDQSVQSIVVAPLAAVNGTSFDGVGEGNPQFPFNATYAPPDTVGEAGLTQYVQWVNASFAIFDKATGTKLYGPAGGNTIWSGFGGDCETRNDGDPIVQYDQLADRWIMTQFALRSGNYLQCVAVSQTSDATGAWHRYAFTYTEFPDYPKLAVWPTAYVITFNMFGATGNQFTGGRVCGYDRAKMLTGAPASQVCVQISSPSLLPADLEGKTLPPAGSPNYVLNRGSNALNLWKFTPNFASPSSTTLTGPTAIPVNGFTPACSSSCVPQPGTSQKLDVLGDRLMYRLSYRNLGTREALVVNHSVNAGSVIGIRWYELNITGGTPSVRQQSTFAPADGQNRWMGSAAMDQAGNIALGYTIGSSTMKPTIKFAGRDATDPLNTLSMDTTLQSGGGSQLANLSRWGDYSTMSIDPSDDCTFWFTTEYLQANGTFNWSTRVGSFKFASCGPSTPPSPSFVLGATPASRTVTQGESTTFDATVTPQNGYTGDGTFTVTGLPDNATGTFSPAGFTGGSGSSTLTVETAPNTPTGTYALNIVAKDSTGTPVQSTTVTLNVNAPVAQDFSISASPSNRVIKRGASGSYNVTIATTGGFDEPVTFSVSGLPSGTTSSFSPASITGNGSSTLTINTFTPSTPKGTYTLTIAGTSASKTRSTTVTLKVQ